MFSVYSIHNQKHKKTYIGQTIDLKGRLEQHNKGTFKGYTSRFDGLWILIYSEEQSSRSDALKREKQLKSSRGRQFIKQFIPA